MITGLISAAVSGGMGVERRKRLQSVKVDWQLPNVNTAVYYFFVFCLFRAAPSAHGASQARS